ncbi:hypothetical protein [Novosphingobium sp. HII-3]|uniref:hypothetical protein n=1 Tax=Novosphingobium sp. HII-3 TaxID=2075565 RepID=UPI0011AF59BE|nr:hypothetical protein [Novosphingobium sp. HII-3]
MSELIGLSLVLAMSPAVAHARASQSATSTADSQNDDQLGAQQWTQTPLETNPTGRTAKSSVGEAGQRMTRDTTAQKTGVKPMARVSNRIQNRVQNRIRNRIDRYYDPQSNATDSLVVAEDQARTGVPLR